MDPTEKWPAIPIPCSALRRRASEKEIKSAYRKLAKKYHPDANKDDPKARERFSEATQAYDIVGDAEKRKQYDAGEIDAEGKPAFAGFAGGGGDPFGGFRRSQGGPEAAHFEFRSGPGGGGGFTEDIFSELFGRAARGGAGGMGGGGRRQSSAGFSPKGRTSRRRSTSRWNRSSAPRR